MRIGHSALNFNLHKIGKHETGRCDKFGNPETVKHILLECDAYEREINQFNHKLGLMGYNKVSLKILLGNRQMQSRIKEEVFDYLKKTGNM